MTNGKVEIYCDHKIHWGYYLHIVLGHKLQTMFKSTVRPKISSAYDSPNNLSLKAGYKQSNGSPCWRQKNHEAGLFSELSFVEHTLNTRPTVQFAYSFVYSLWGNSKTRCEIPWIHIELIIKAESIFVRAKRHLNIFWKFACFRKKLKE